MLNKSRIYKEAAVCLLREGQYSQAVSIFYYAALQKMMFAYAEKLQPSLPYCEQTRPEVNTHRCVFDGVYMAIKNKERDGFCQSFWKLHQMRREAEYDAKEQTQEDAVEARDLCDRLEGYLLRNCGIH